MIHFTDLQTLFPKTPKATLDASVDALNAAMAKFDISTSARKAAFLAQVGHESGGFVHMVENLNYSADALLRVFGKYFNRDRAVAYQRNPQKIASRVYANRMGNGDEGSGEGWTFRGRGFIQLTGKANYQAFATAMGMKLADVIPYLETRAGAAMSAAWFWSTNGLNALADHAQFSKITQRVNGGQNGAAERLALYEKAKRLV